MSVVPRPSRSATRRGRDVAKYLWALSAALHLVSLVVAIMTGASTFEHEALMMLALVLAKLDAIEGGW